MSKSFDFVDEKIREADFFLDQLSESGMRMNQVRFHFNAFVSASRSITFSLQAVMNSTPGFREWYKPKQEALKANETCQFFKTIRDQSLHIGSTPVNSGSMRTLENGDVEVKYWFKSDDPLIPLENAPEEDVVTSCRSYLTTLIQLVYECYVEFGDIIDPRQYFSNESIARRGWTPEHIEKYLGFPTGWSKTEGLSDSERIEALRKHIPDSLIDPIFVKYLGVPRPS